MNQLQLGAESEGKNIGDYGGGIIDAQRRWCAEGWICLFSCTQEYCGAIEGLLCNGSKNVQLKNRKAEKGHSCSHVDAVDVLSTKHSEGRSKVQRWPLM